MPETGATSRRLIRRDRNHTLFHSRACRDNSDIRAPVTTAGTDPDTRNGASPYLVAWRRNACCVSMPHPRGDAPPAVRYSSVMGERSALDHPHLDFGLHVGVELDRDLVDAECLDRFVQIDLTLLDVQSLRLELLGDVAGGD